MEENIKMEKLEDGNDGMTRKCRKNGSHTYLEKCGEQNKPQNTRRKVTRQPATTIDPST